MTAIAECKVPEGSLLSAYAGGEAYTDCYSADVSMPVIQAQFVEAFYTTPLFKVERFFLRLASRPSTDVAAKELALGQTETFAMWRVENRKETELLLAVGRTRSWLMAKSGAGQDSNRTRLYFGSAIVPNQKGQLGFGVTALQGFHKLYSRALLHAARLRLERAK